MKCLSYTFQAEGNSSYPKLQRLNGALNVKRERQGQDRNSLW